MSETALILHTLAGADFNREQLAQLAPNLPSVAHRTVTDPAMLAAALHEQPWCAILHEANENNAPYSFLDSLPGMACQIRLDSEGELHFPYASEGCFDLFGIPPHELLLHPALLINRLHPDDVRSFRQGMLLSAQNACAWNWEGRIVLPPGQEIKWVNLRAKHRRSDADGTHWKAFLVNITHNKMVEIELKQSRQRLRELSSHIEQIKEAERTRIAREIHDEIGMLITALKMDVAWLAQRLPTDKPALQKKADDMVSLLDTAGRAANDLVHSLRPGYLDCFGIVATIEIEAREFSNRTGIPCKIVKSDDQFDIPDEQSITLYRIFQEALNNIMKHAAARHVVVKILKTDAGKDSTTPFLKLIMSDDGCGFDEAASNKPRSFGLRGIRERIRQLNGRLTIRSGIGKGTTLTVRLPLKTAQNTHIEAQKYTE